MTEYKPPKITPESQQIEVLKLVISAVERAAKTAKTQAVKNGDSFVSQEFDCIAQDLDYFLSEMKLCGVGSTITASKRKPKMKD